MQCDQPVDRGEPGRGEQGHGPHLPQVGGTRPLGVANCPAAFLSHFHCGFVMKYKDHNEQYKSAE